jgi:hypothetical protein
VTVHSWFPFAALTLLAEAGEVELDVLTRSMPNERSIWLEVDDHDAGFSASVCIDLVDRGELAAPQRSAAADVTWKRSFDPAGYGSTTVVPYGLQLSCRAGSEPTMSYARRLVRGVSGLKQVAGAWRVRPPLLAEYEERPPRGEPRVVFQVWAWDPGAGPDPDDRVARTQERANLIRTLRARLGDAFVGGFVDTPYARDTFPDCVAAGPTDFRSYLHVTQRCSIGVSTAGLQGSNPYKIAEYLAGSLAIVSEPLQFTVPDVPPMRTFETPDECASRCEELLTDPSSLQRASADAWAAAHRPDVLFRRRLDDLRYVLGISRSS